MDESDFTCFASVTQLVECLCEVQVVIRSIRIRGTKSSGKEILPIAVTSNVLQINV